MKVKVLKKLLELFDDELEVYLQERTQRSPYHRLYAMCNMEYLNIAIQQNGEVVYLAIGDVVTERTTGFCHSDNSVIKYVNPKKH